LAAKHTNATKARDARILATEEKKRKREGERILQVEKKKEHDETNAKRARERELTGLTLLLVNREMRCKLA
jgi:hypothetical protein